MRKHEHVAGPASNPRLENSTHRGCVTSLPTVDIIMHLVLYLEQFVFFPDD